MSSIDPSKLHEVQTIFLAAAKLAPEERAAFLDKSCENNSELRQSVDLMLMSSDQAGSFMKDPAIGSFRDSVTESGDSIYPGMVLSFYRILNILGKGGMGNVYLAEDTRLERKVALKILPAALASDADTMRRFLREAKAASALNHTNILTIYENGEADGLNFIATEYVEGDTLTDLLGRGPLSLAVVFQIATQTLSALQAAHAAGIVHRDMKPANLMIRRDGVVKLLDFGIAKLVEPAPHAELATAPGMIVGTPNYMSPEQARGKVVDARSDLFSFGLVLYEMLTNKPAFRGANAMDVISSILRSEPTPISEIRPDLPLSLGEIIDKATKKNCDERFQTAADLLAGLEDVKTSMDLRGSPVEGYAHASETQGTNRRKPATAESHRPTTSSAEYLITGIRQHKRVALAVVSVLFLACIGLGYRLFQRNADGLKQIESIAVLPFTSEASNADIDYLSDGLTQTLISNLSQLPSLKVRARSSVLHYKGADLDMARVAKELNVEGIVNGRLTQRGDQISLYVELINISADKVVWSRTYDRQMSGLLSLQQDIARDISSNLRTKLSGTDALKLSKNYTQNSDAYRLYLKGQYEWNKHTEEALQKATQYYNQALEIDPNYALAYCGLSEVFGVSGNNYGSPRDDMPKAKEFASRAIEIDDSLAEAHAMMGGILLYYDWDFAGAQAEVKRAHSLDPNSAEPYLFEGDWLDHAGRFDEALVARRKALEIGPLSPFYNWSLGSTYYFKGDLDLAVKQLQQTIDLEPGFGPTYLFLGQAYEQKKMYAEAIRTFQRGLSRAEPNPKLMAGLGHAYAMAGDRQHAEKTLSQLREMSKQRYISPYYFAVIYEGLGQKDEMFASLENAYQDRPGVLIWLRVEPMFDPVRDDPRFQDLIKRIGL